jgi:cardiolipin synthase
MEYNNEDIREVLLEPMDPPEPGFPAQVVASGPTGRYSAASEMFETLLYSARRELLITTPYYVPNDPMQAASTCVTLSRGPSPVFERRYPFVEQC